jgi:hypothetical protein
VHANAIGNWSSGWCGPILLNIGFRQSSTSVLSIYIPYGNRGAAFSARPTRIGRSHSNQTSEGYYPAFSRDGMASPFETHGIHRSRQL